MVRGKLKIIPFYTGDETVDEALKNKKSISLLWLEILFNDYISWESYLAIPEIKSAYEKACVWYSNFRTLIDSATKRRPLEKREGRIDNREYRKFLEALNFVAG